MDLIQCGSCIRRDNLSIDQNFKAKTTKRDQNKAKFCLKGIQAAQICDEIISTFSIIYTRSKLRAFIREKKVKKANEGQKAVHIRPST